MSPDDIELLLSGCAGLWDLEAQVERRCDGSIRMTTERAAVIVSRGSADDRPTWCLTIEGTASGLPDRIGYGSVVPMLRGLRALLAPELPLARLIIAPSPDAGP